MIEWSEQFETKIEMVDTQHQRLFVLLNSLADCFTVGVPNEEMVEQVL